MKQKQTTKEGSTSIQSGHNTEITIIENGFSQDDIKAVCQGLAETIIPAYTSTALATVNTRLKEFEEELLKRFATSETADASAFQDPDFQFTVKHAQQTYVRSGEENTKTLLADLIEERSKVESRNRLALTLNSAIEKVAQLTTEELSAISLSFILIRTTQPYIKNRDDFIKFFKRDISPFLEDISREDTSFEFLVSQSCATINYSTKMDLLRIFRNNFTGLVTKGFSNSEIDEILSEDEKKFLLSINVLKEEVNEQDRVRVNVLKKDMFENLCNQHGVEKELQQRLWGRNESTLFNKDELIEHFSPEIPEIALLFDLWENTLLCRMFPTSIGVAIGHSNLSRSPDFKGDIDIWIK